MPPSPSSSYWQDEARRYDGLVYRGHYHRRVAEQEEEFVVSQLLPGKTRVLEVGPGVGRITRHLLSLSQELVVCDINQHVLQALADRLGVADGLTLICQPLERLREHVDGKRFEAAVAIRVLPYLDDWRSGLKQLAELVQPQGLVIFDLWNGRSFEGWWQRLTGRQLPVQPRLATVPQMHHAIESAGLQVRATYRWGYPRLGTLSLDNAGSLLSPRWAYSTTFCCHKR